MATLLGRPGLWLAALWGFAEGTLFFVVPDVLFTLTTVFSPKRGLQQLGAATLGAVVAGAVMYVWSAEAPAQARAAVAAVPFVGEKIITPAEQRWNQEGVWTLYAHPLGGVPYKVHAVLAPPRLSLTEFVLASVPMRAERMVLSWILFVPLAWWHAREARQRRIVAVRIHAVFWVLLYAVYWSANYR
jgi:hypothetical protein